MYEKCGSVQVALVLLHNVSEEGEAEEVIGHVSCVEHQPSVGAALLSGCQGDLAVLHHLITPIHLADHTHRLRRIGFFHHLETYKKKKDSVFCSDNLTTTTLNAHVSNHYCVIY